MSKIIITYNEVVDLNHILEDKALNYKVHLHDRCGGQSFTLKSSSDDSEPEQIEQVKSEIIRYFDAKKMTLRFTEDNLEFTIN